MRPDSGAYMRFARCNPINGCKKVSVYYIFIQRSERTGHAIILHDGINKEPPSILTLENGNRDIVVFRGSSFRTPAVPPIFGMVRSKCLMGTVLPQGELCSRSTWAWLGCFLNLEVIKPSQGSSYLSYLSRRVDGISELRWRLMGLMGTPRFTRSPRGPSGPSSLRQHYWWDRMGVPIDPDSFILILVLLIFECSVCKYVTFQVEGSQSSFWWHWLFLLTLIWGKNPLRWRRWWR